MSYRVIIITGEIINDFYVSDVSYLTYESDELRYTTSKNYNEEGTLTSETFGLRWQELIILPSFFAPNYVKVI